MNRCVDVLNRIRQSAIPGWLTPSQRAAYDLVRQRLAFLDEVNLWGDHGVGKTFLGWVLRTQRLAVYAPRLEDVQPAPPIRTIVVDNLGWQRVEVRDALHHCRTLGYDKVVLVTKDLVQDQMSTVRLRLTEADVEQVAANLRSVSVAPYDATPRNLWDLVSPLSLRE